MTTDTLDSKRALRAARLTEVKRFARRFFRNPLGVVGLLIVLALLFTAAFANLLQTHDPYLPTLSDRLAAPGAEYWLGAANFFAITKYNRSFFYAMSVIDLSRAVRASRTLDKTVNATAPAVPLP